MHLQVLQKVLLYPIQTLSLLKILYRYRLQLQKKHKNLAAEIKQLAAAQGKDSAQDLQKIEEALEQAQTPEFNSLEMLQQQQQAGASLLNFSLSNLKT